MLAWQGYSRAMDNANYEARISNDKWSVHDVDNAAVWSPDDEIQAEIASAADQAAKAIEICRERPWAAEWSW